MIIEEWEDDVEGDWEIKWVAEVDKWVGKVTVNKVPVIVEKRTRKETMQALLNAIEFSRIKKRSTSDQR